MTISNKLHPAFQHNIYLFRRNFWALLRGVFRVYDERGNILFYYKQEVFKKKDLRIYANESQKQELLNIKPVKNLQNPLEVTFNVQDLTKNEYVGALRTETLTFLNEVWVFLSKEGREIGNLTEKSIIRALLYRFIPQAYIIISDNGREVAEIQKHFNPFIFKCSMRILPYEPLIDRRLLISAGILSTSFYRRKNISGIDRGISECYKFWIFP